MPSMRVSKMFSFVRVIANIFSKVVCFLRSFILVAQKDVENDIVISEPLVRISHAQCSLQFTTK
jgi:hypothetical protein